MTPPSLLELLRDEAVTLVESDLPSAEEVRQLVGALVRRVERFEKKVLGEELAKPPAAEAPHVPTELEQAEQELQAAEARVKALQQEQPPAPVAPPAVTAPPAPQGGTPDQGWGASAASSEAPASASTPPAQ